MIRISYHARRAGSTQQTFCPMLEVERKMLRLQIAGAQEWLAVLEVQGLDDSLRSEEEQYRLNEHFQQILVSLPHPFQLLLRTAPIDLEHSLPSLVLTPSQEAGVLADDDSAQQRRIETGMRLSTSHVQFIKKRTPYQTQLERRVYLVIPALADTIQEETGTPFARMPRSQSHGEQLRAAQEAWLQLAIRCQDLERRLSTISLTTHRLSSDQLIELAYSCHRPQEARINPLRTSWIKEVKQLTRQAIEQDCAQVLDIHILPVQITPGWLSQLMHIDEVMDISFFSHSQPTATTVQRQENDRYLDPGRVAAQRDTERLIERIIVGHDRAPQFVMHVHICGKGRRETYTRAERVRATLFRLRLGSLVASFKQRKGICYTHHQLWINRHPRPLRSYEVSSIFPFLFQTPFDTNGILDAITCTGDPL